MNVMAAARTFGLSRRTLYNWMDAGKLPFTRVTSRSSGRQVRIEDVQACVAGKWKRAATSLNQEAAMEGKHKGATENADAPEPMTADGSDGSEINPPKAEPSGDTDSGTDGEQGKTE